VKACALRPSQLQDLLCQQNAIRITGSACPLKARAHATVVQVPVVQHDVQISANAIAGLCVVSTDKGRDLWCSRSNSRSVGDWPASHWTDSSMEYPGFVGGSYESAAVTADQEKTVNWYAERMESSGATSRTVLYPTPGVTLLSEASTGPGRAHFALNGREFAVIGPTFFEIDTATGAQTNRGTVTLDGRPATISSNGDAGGELFITSGTNGYVYDLGANTLTQIATLNGQAYMGAHVDGYFLALNSAISRFRISDLLDGTTWDTTQFADRSIAPDRWQSMREVGRYIWLLGSDTSEVWYNSGASPFPFAPHPSGYIPYGIAGPFTATVMGRDIMWLGRTKDGQGMVLRASGFTPEVVSTYPIQAALSSNTDAQLALAVADSYADQGHTFFMLSTPALDTTLCWDAETRLWAERGTWISEDNTFVPWRPRWFAFNGGHRALDNTTGAVYTVSTAVATDVDSRPIRRVRRAPALVVENQRVFYPGFELDLEPGLGLTTGQGSDPQVMMHQSQDGGKTWGAEHWRSAGKVGDYHRRVRWNRCGSARRMVFEVAVSDPIPWRLTNAYLTPDPQPVGMQRRSA
jgi:hypothetical protein